jgi:hypothetical protein
MAGDYKQCCYTVKTPGKKAGLHGAPQGSDTFPEIQRVQGPSQGGRTHKDNHTGSGHHVRTPGRKEGVRRVTEP